MTDVRTAQTRTLLASYLVLFSYEGEGGDDVALDMIEFIALRLPDASDATVFDLAIWLRETLAAYARKVLTFCEVLNRLVSAASAALTGEAALIETLHRMRVRI